MARTSGALHSALDSFPIVGEQIGESLQSGPALGSATALVIGFLGAVHGRVPVPDGRRLRLVRARTRSCGPAWSPPPFGPAPDKDHLDPDSSYQARI